MSGHFISLETLRDLFIVNDTGKTSIENGCSSSVAFNYEEKLSAMRRRRETELDRKLVCERERENLLRYYLLV